MIEPLFTNNQHLCLYDKLKALVYHSKSIRVRNRNVAYASVDINLPGDRSLNNLELLGLSGSDVSKNLINQLGNTVDGRIIVDDVAAAKSRFDVNLKVRGRHTEDAELKILEYIVNQMEKTLNTNLSRNKVYHDFSGTIKLNSEMRPCDSCEEIIQKQFKLMFPNIKLEVKYGVELELIS